MNQKLENEDSHPPSGLISKIKKFFRNPFFIKTQSVSEVIEVAPLAYLRGRTLNNAFIIMDESQNTTVEQMKMVLTRTGYGSQAVINGDLTQIDLPKHITSGLDHVIHVLKDTSGIGIVEFSSHDVIRHPLVRKIIDAYKKFESNINK